MTNNLEEIFWIEERGYYTKEPIDKPKLKNFEPVGSPIHFPNEGLAVTKKYIEENKPPYLTNAFCRSEDFESKIISIQYYKIHE